MPGGRGSRSRPVQSDRTYTTKEVVKILKEFQRDVSLESTDCLKFKKRALKEGHLEDFIDLDGKAYAYEYVAHDMLGDLIRDVECGIVGLPKKNVAI